MYPIYATTLAACFVKPKLIGPEFILGIGSDIGVIDYIYPGTEKLASKAGQVIEKSNVIYLKNPGLLSVGKDSKEAYTRTILAEQMAKMPAISLSMGRNIKALNAKQISMLLKTIS